jgi:CubicO group peptidase (beta-lactamase class C family)
LDDRVSDHIPEFAAAGKREVTVRHLFTHTGGLTDPVEICQPWEDAVSVICAAPLQEGWRPGRDYAYNSVGMWILGELVARFTHRPFHEYVKTEVLAPVGLHHTWMRMPDDVYERCKERVAALPGYELSGTRSWVTWGRPTGGIHGPIGDLGRFYSALLGHRVLPAPVLEAMTARHLCGVRDRNVGLIADRGLGFSLASSFAGHSYGPHASSRTYGHAGGTWCTGFADPAHGLAAAVYWNGRLDPDTNARVVPALLGALYEDLGLAA